MGGVKRVNQLNIYVSYLYCQIDLGIEKNEQLVVELFDK